MTTLHFAVVDVFTWVALLGNQLGIVILDDTTSTTLTQERKLAITIEFNYSETIFIHPYDSKTSSRRVDIFTPKGEIPFAGHPTIGAVGYIFKNLSPEKDGGHLQECLIDLKAGRVVGRIDQNSGYATAEMPQDVHVHAVQMDWEKVVASQPSLRHETIVQSLKHKRHAVVSAVKGVNFALIDLTEQPDLLTKVQIVNSYVVNNHDLDEGWREGLTGSLFFVRKADQGDGIVRIDQRVIVIGLEDPATGAASCALTAHLALEHGGKASVQSFELEQGTQMGRKSVIGSEVSLSEDGSKVDKIVLSGQTVQTMKGELMF